jgi:pimeloyl-ACP methyl ester carboxylesterase
VDANKIFLLGHGQAGYVISVATKEVGEKLAGTIFISSPTVSLTAHELQATALRMEADGFSNEQIDEALNYQAFFFEYLEGKKSEEDFEAQGKSVAGKPYNSYLTLPGNADYLKWWRARYKFNPQDFLQNSKVPFLAIYGGDDLLVPTPQNADLFTNLIKSGQHPDSDVKILPNANHLMLLGEKRGDIQLTEIIGYHEDFFNIIRRWINSRKG